MRVACSKHKKCSLLGQISLKTPTKVPGPAPVFVFSETRHKTEACHLVPLNNPFGEAAAIDRAVGAILAARLAGRAEAPLKSTARQRASDFLTGVCPQRTA
jgi:hypothetical protein